MASTIVTLGSPALLDPSEWISAFSTFRPYLTIVLAFIVFPQITIMLTSIHFAANCAAHARILGLPGSVRSMFKCPTAQTRHADPFPSVMVPRRDLALEPSQDSSCNL